MDICGQADGAPVQTQARTNAPNELVFERAQVNPGAVDVVLVEYTNVVRTGELTLGV